MKHIGLVVPVFPVASETFVLTEINALVADGHQVTVFRFSKGTATHLSMAAGVNVVDLALAADIPISQCYALGLSALFKGLTASFKQSSCSTMSLLRYGSRLGYWAKQLGCTHLHSHFLTSSLAHAIVAGELCGIPVSCVGHGHDVYQTPTDLKQKLDHCAFVVAVCNDMKSTLKKQTSKPIHVIHCGVNLSQFQYSEGPNNTVLKLLFIGRLVEKKGLVYALNALADIDTALQPELHIVGDGELKKRLNVLIKDKKLESKVKLLGYKPPTWLQQNAGRYDALIAPFCQAKNGDRDTGPVVLKEAMAMGLPVITTAFMGCKEIVTHQTGYLVPPKSSMALTTAIERFARLSHAQRQQMRQQARAHSEQAFCALNQAQVLSELIQQGENYVSV